MILINENKFEILLIFNFLELELILKRTISNSEL